MKTRGVPAPEYSGLGAVHMVSQCGVVRICSATDFEALVVSSILSNMPLAIRVSRRLVAALQQGSPRPGHLDLRLFALS